MAAANRKLNLLCVGGSNARSIVHACLYVQNSPEYESFNLDETNQAFLFAQPDLPYNLMDDTLSLETDGDNRYQLILQRLTNMLDGIDGDGIHVFVWVVETDDNEPRALAWAETTLHTIRDYLGRNILDYSIFIISGDSKCCQIWKSHFRFCCLQWDFNSSYKGLDEQIVCINAQTAQVGASFNNLVEKIDFIHKSNKNQTYTAVSLAVAQEALAVRNRGPSELERRIQRFFSRGVRLHGAAVSPFFMPSPFMQVVIAIIILLSSAIFATVTNKVVVYFSGYDWGISTYWMLFWVFYVIRERRTSDHTIIITLSVMVIALACDKVVVYLAGDLTVFSFDWGI